MSTNPNLTSKNAEIASVERHNQNLNSDSSTLHVRVSNGQPFRLSIKIKINSKLNSSTVLN
jgi:hypothetical protein